MTSTARKARLALPQRRVGRFGIALLDQAASSASNLLLSVLVARQVAPATFGFFSLLLVGYALALGIVRALCGIPLTILAEDHDATGGFRHSQAANTMALLVGCCGSLALVPVLLLTHHTEQRLTLCFIVGFPVLMLQDTVRYSSFARLYPARAAMSDAIWLAVQLIGLVAPYGRHPFGSTSIWILGAALGCVFIYPSRKPTMTPSAALNWIKSDNIRRRYLAAEALANMGSAQLSLLLLAILGGLSVVAGIRGATTVLGISSAVLAGLSPVTSTELARARLNQKDQWRVVSIFICIGVIGPLLVGLAAVDLPVHVGGHLLGRTWALARVCFLPMAMASALYTPVSALVLLAAARRNTALAFQLRTVSTIPVLLMILIPVFHHDSQGAAIAWALGSVLGLGLAILVWNTRLQRSPVSGSECG